MTTEPDTTSPEDNDAEGGGVSPKTIAERNQAILNDIIHRESAGTPDRSDMGVPQQPVYMARVDSKDAREQAVRSLHAYVATTLADKRHRRDMLEDEIRELVGEEYRLGRMVRILDRAKDNDGERSDNGTD